MKNLSIIIIILFLFITSCSEKEDVRNSFYITNQAPLIQQPLTQLPIGDIKPTGWLMEMLELQRSGLTGHLDSIYALVCGPNNGWLGGTGDGWERGPYWLDGLVPLAYILDDENLKSKAQKWIEWSIENQEEDGYFGPVPLPEGYEKIEGTQQGNREDWWPKMVMLKVLQQYYMATQDERILELMDRYFQYQFRTLGQYPLDTWTFWANRRGGDNLAVVYWLYNITGKEYLLELAEILFSQTYNWTEVYSGEEIRSQNPLPHLHCVNVAQGLKQPVVYYQQHPEAKYTESVKTGLRSLQQVHGFVNGMYGGDERLHGNDPTQGSELCSAIEMMFSFENILQITGDIFYADYLEKIAYNVLPTQHNDEFTRRQYFQQANQVVMSDESRNFFNDEYSRIVYGVLTGYPCCTSNMHQGWPKFIQNLWYATPDNGLAIMLYGPSEVKAQVSKGEWVRFAEETDYPFRDRIRLIYLEGPEVYFPLHLRIPGWCMDPEIRINGKMLEMENGSGIVVLDRDWKEGDVVEMDFPMEIRISEWDEDSRGIERGPLVYALRIEERWEEKKTAQWPNSFFEVYPESPWNYGFNSEKLTGADFHVVEKNIEIIMPWNLAGAPVELTTSAIRIPDWIIEKNSAGKIPVRNYFPKADSVKFEEIRLIPYGCTALRISQFPVVRLVDDYF